MANRTFNDMQALERQVKKLNFEAAYIATVAAFGSLATTTPIVVTAATSGIAANGATITIAVNAAAANPTDTVLAVVTGTSAAILITITPNDGTNNGATPVPLTTAELRELIATGTVGAKTVTLTDAGSLLDEITATGGGADNLAAAGEGDGEVATLAGGVDAGFTLTRGYGISSISQTATGEYKIELEDKFFFFLYINLIVVGSTARDFDFQVKEYDVNPTSGTPYITIYTLTGATPTQLNDSDIIHGEITLKNTSVI